MSDEPSLSTRLVHAGEPRPRLGGAAVVPIFQSTVFEEQEKASYDDIRYPRLNNTPNHVVLGEKLASLEGGEAGLVTGSGMAAITTTLLSVLQGGGHLLVQDCLYGGTHSFVHHDLAQFGIAFDVIDVQRPATWERKLKPTTRAVYVETMTNPLLAVADHRAVVEFARSRGLVSVIDNTFATPVNFRPLTFGYDLVVHSATKYLNGHSDLCAGAVVGAVEPVQKIRHLLNHLGGSLDPHACFLLHRGVRTLELRVLRQNQNAQRLAEYLATHPDVCAVHYPGLPSHPHHARARELFLGCGGVLAFELRDGAQQALKMIDKLRLPVHGPSLGGIETLITRPVDTSHAGLTAAERQAIGIGDALVRVAIGIEDPADLIADFAQALGAR
jgi:cystathionine beta-lyase/cystathionine gamma-synthase